MVKSRLAHIDFYKKLPSDLSEATSHGSSLTMVMIAFILVFLGVELWDFSRTPIESHVGIDPGNQVEDRLRINFNITMLDMACEYATVDMTDVLGTRRANITKHIEKWHLDDNGVRISFAGSNREQTDILHQDHLPSLDVLHRHGVHAVQLSNPEFKAVMNDPDQLIFVNFFAPWCPHCQRLAPVWEAFAQEIEAEDDELADFVGVVSVDCEANKRLCRDERVRAYPTLRFYHDGKEVKPGYTGDRTVQSLLQFTKEHMNMVEQRRYNPAKASAVEATRIAQYHVEHPQCMLIGFVEIKRVPGSLQIAAQSKHHNFDAGNTNASHVINHLSFGVATKKRDRRLARFPESMRQSTPADGTQWVSLWAHAGKHHFFQVVHTRYELLSLFRHKVFYAYQMTHASATMRYDATEAPKAKFDYRINPIGVTVKKGGRKWYEFLTSLAALLGGTVTLFGMLNMALGNLAKGGLRVGR